MRVGFIGLGSMGAGIARRIARSGYELVACDILPETLDAFDEPGAIRIADPFSVASQVDTVCICVRTDEQLSSLAADGRLFGALGAGGLFIIHSTVAPDLVRSLAHRAEAYGVDVVDAGVSGGAPAALAGKLSIFVGAEPETFERARPLLECYGGSVVLLGPPGRGQEGKLLNNLVSIANYGMAAAILDLGERLNFDREQLRQALLAGSADSYAMRLMPGLLPRGAGAAAAKAGLRDLLAKDVEHASNLAPADDHALIALLSSCEVMLDHLRRGTAEDV
jgi:3-hydroxyisobutyrate dehydrogenase